jgi:hypothetical protein
MPASRAARLTRFHALTALIGKTQSSPKVSSVRNACSSAQVPRESRTTRVLPPLPVTFATPSTRLRQRSVTRALRGKSDPRGHRRVGAADRSRRRRNLPRDDRRDEERGDDLVAIAQAHKAAGLPNPVAQRTDAIPARRYRANEDGSADPQGCADTTRALRTASAERVAYVTGSSGTVGFSSAYGKCPLCTLLSLQTSRVALHSHRSACESAYHLVTHQACMCGQSLIGPLSNASANASSAAHNVNHSGG